MLKKKFFKTKDEAEITFLFATADAKKVALVSNFNGWKPVAMKFSKKNKAFSTKVRMPKNSEFQFRYLLDGENWANDDAADSYVINEHGGQNCVVSTTA